MPLVVYLDEVGNHTLEAEDKDFPVFAAVLLICDAECYVQQVVPTANQLKFDFFGHEGVILHSRDIRKAQGEFGFLTDPAKRQAFYEALNRLMGTCDYKLMRQPFGRTGSRRDTFIRVTLTTLHSPSRWSAYYPCWRP